MKKRFLTIIGIIIGIILMTAALFTVIHYIWSDLYIAEFDADNAETAIWAQATLESGKLLDPDYQGYTQLLPVAGNLFFAPFVKIFGVGITALRAGYTALAVIFTALLVLALRVCLPSWDLAMIGGGLIMIFTTATDSLRDIFWAHTVYYSVSVFFILMCIGSLALCLRGKRVFGGILFFLSALLCSINSNVVLLYTALPLFAALFLESMNQERQSKGFMKNPLLFIFIAMICGFILHKWICSGFQQTSYMDRHTQLSQASQWAEHLRLLPERWLGLFFDLPEESIPVMSSVGIKLVIRLGTALVLSVLPFFSFAALRDTKSRMTRIVILYHWILCAVLLFLFVFGMISEQKRRLIPLWFSCLVVDWLTIIWLLKEKGFLRIAAIGSVCLTMLFAGMTAVSVARKPADLSVWYDNDAIYNVLETHGLTRGYITEYWYTNSIKVLSESRINLLEIEITEDGFKIPYDNQGKGSWYKETPTEERTFLVCYERELLRQYPWLADEAVEILRATQYTLDTGQPQGFFILVYDHDIVAEKLQESAFANVGTQEN